MDINRKNKNINKKSKVKKSKKRVNKISFKTLAIFFAFELFFTGCTFPFYFYMDHLIMRKANMLEQQ